MPVMAEGKGQVIPSHVGAAVRVSRRLRPR